MSRVAKYQRKVEIVASWIEARERRDYLRSLGFRALVAEGADERIRVIIDGEKSKRPLSEVPTRRS